MPGTCSSIAIPTVSQVSHFPTSLRPMPRSWNSPWSTLAPAPMPKLGWLVARGLGSRRTRLEMRGIGVQPRGCVFSAGRKPSPRIQTGFANTRGAWTSSLWLCAPWRSWRSCTQRVALRRPRCVHSRRAGAPRFTWSTECKDCGLRGQVIGRWLWDHLRGLRSTRASSAVATSTALHSGGRSCQRAICPGSWRGVCASSATTSSLWEICAADRSEPRRRRGCRQRMP
mmetsp:Transcript_88065/g.221646  ORF Transcript_88065/g.221646 Transcript_88065/m.221646 type:complete len:227 (+) Transcript_88065:262-942(+)